VKSLDADFVEAIGESRLQDNEEESSRAEAALDDIASGDVQAEAEPQFFADIDGTAVLASHANVRSVVTLPKLPPIHDAEAHMTENVDSTKSGDPTGFVTSIPGEVGGDRHDRSGSCHDSLD
jgi:hypothetical protein